MPTLETTISHIGLDQVDPSPWQTRRFGKKPDPQLRELAESIGEVGVLQPVLVRPVGDRFELVAGERRVRAARLAKMKTVPAIVRELPDDIAAQVCVVENLQREDLNPVEQGHAVALLLERDGWTADTVAAEIGRSATWVARRASLWTRLSDAWKDVAGETDHPAAAWPTANLEVVARLDVADQDAILAKHRNDPGSWFWHSDSRELRRETDNRLRQLCASPAGEEEGAPQEGRQEEDHQEGGEEEGRHQEGSRRMIGRGKQSELSQLAGLAAELRKKILATKRVVSAQRPALRDQAADLADNIAYRLRAL